VGLGFWGVSCIELHPFCQGGFAKSRQTGERSNDGAAIDRFDDRRVLSVANPLAKTEGRQFRFEFLLAHRGRQRLSDHHTQARQVEAASLQPLVGQLIETL
jgi:hypothetical protein